jgi:hypothetical protein
MQFDEKVSFQLATGGSSLWVTASGIAFDVLRPKEIVATVKAESPRFDCSSSRPKASDVERLVVSEDLSARTPHLDSSLTVPNAAFITTLSAMILPNGERT